MAKVHNSNTTKPLTEAEAAAQYEELCVLILQYPIVARASGIPQEDTSDLVWINIRIGRNGLVGLSKFCQGCQSLLRQSGFKRAFYSTNSDNFEEFALAD